MADRWIVRDRLLHERNGNGVWADAHTRLGAKVMRRKIVLGRYRGSRPHAWRRSDFYTPPPLSALVVLRGGDRGE